MTSEKSFQLPSRFPLHRLPRTRRFVGLLAAAWSEYEDDYARYFAGAMVYYALVSLVPVILLLLAALGLLLRLSDTAIAAQQQVLHVVESNFGAELGVAIEGLLTRLEHGSIVATFVSVGGLAIAASVLFKHLRMTFRAIWKHAPVLKSGSVRVTVQATILERAIAFAMVLAGGALLLTSFTVIAAARWLARFFGDVPLVGQVANGLLVLLSPAVIVPLTFALLYKFLPPIRLRWKDVWLAAVLAGIAWIIGTELLALYAAFFGDDFNAYGAIGGVLAGMVWLYAVSQVLFFGAELCKVVYRSSLQTT